MPKWLPVLLLTLTLLHHLDLLIQCHACACCQSQGRWQHHHSPMHGAVSRARSSGLAPQRNVVKFRQKLMRRYHMPIPGDAAIV